MAPPKLLDKKQVHIVVAQERRQQIETGIALAKKVDAVRDSLQEEEKNLETFRSQTIVRVQAERDSYVRQRDTALAELEKIRKEVSLLQERKTQELLQLPPDEQWERVEAIFTKYDHDVRKLEALQQAVLEQIDESGQKAHELEVERGRIEDIKRLASENLAHADIMLAEAKESAADMRNRAQVVLNASQLREQEVVYKERDIEARELEVEKDKERIRESEIDLIKREAVLKDRYATLERTLKRINQ